MTDPKPPFPGLLGPAWRNDHARQGDEALKLAERTARRAELNLADLGYVNAMAAIAQAHYAAANVRARPE